VDRAAIEDLFGQWEKGDFATGLSVYDPEIRFSGTQPEGQVEAAGLPALGDFMKRFLADWERYRVELHELEDLGGGDWLARATQHGIGRTSRMELTAPVHIALAVREGRITQLEFHLRGREDALAALGRTDADA
jgi:ketosteroid isomerase-like protein